MSFKWYRKAAAALSAKTSPSVTPILARQRRSLSPDISIEPD
jgi:hypothetical protein